MSSRRIRYSQCQVDQFPIFQRYEANKFVLCQFDFHAREQGHIENQTQDSFCSHHQSGATAVSSSMILRLGDVDAYCACTPLFPLSVGGRGRIFAFAFHDSVEFCSHGMHRALFFFPCRKLCIGLFMNFDLACFLGGYLCGRRPWLSHLRRWSADC